MRDGLPSYPDKLEIVPFAKLALGRVTVPGSKSITNRALVLAALLGRNQECDLLRILRSEDTEVMITALRQLGFRIELKVDDRNCTASFRVHNSERWIPASEAD